MIVSESRFYVASILDKLYECVYFRLTHGESEQNKLWRDNIYNPFFCKLARYAIAIASAASSGLGMVSSLKMILSAFCTCSFLAVPFQDIPRLTWSGVNSWMRRPFLWSVRSMAPRAWATSIPVFWLLKKKSFSMPQTVGR